jgi:hypothetical protein
VSWQQLREALEEEGLGTVEIFHIGWALGGEHVQSIEIFSDNSNYFGWKICKDEDGHFVMEKVP